MASCWKCQAIQPVTFGELVKSWRGARSLREASTACALSASTLSRIENGELPDMRSFAALVPAIGVDIAFAFELVGRQLVLSPDGSAVTPEAVEGRAT